MKKKFRFVLGPLAFLLIAAISAEAFSALFLYSKLGSLDLKALYGAEVSSIPDLGECSWGDGTLPHPYFNTSYIRDEEKPRCKRQHVNSWGLIGREFPLERDPEFFTILVLGGSVAEFFTLEPNFAKPHLETILNERYISPNGKPFRILNGAITSTHQPNQVSVCTFFCPLVDGVISIEGHNEFRGEGPSRVAAVYGEWQVMNQVRSGYLSEVAWLAAAGRFFRFSAATFPIKYSYTGFFLALSLRKFASTELLQEILEIQIIPLFPENASTRFDELRIQEYKSYLISLAGIAQAHGVLSAIFFQPLPALFKNLTDEEKKVAGNLSYRDSYLRLVNEMLATNAKGLSIHSLLEVFKDESGTIYNDTVHYKKHGNGYFLVAQEIAVKLAREWKFRVKQNPSRIASSTGKLVLQGP